MTVRKKWTNELIKTELRSSMKTLDITRMPTTTELLSLGRNDLHCKISKTKGYQGWSEKLGLQRKMSETVLGQQYEDVVRKKLILKGYNVQQMTTGHAYDLTIEGCVKVDVKVANVHMLNGKSRIHAIRLSKIDPTCDIYICALLDEYKDIERLFIIPSHFLKQQMMQVGRKSKYDIYIDRYDYIEKYVDFYKGIV